MPFYRGETLANRLKKNSFIPMRQARRIAVELTRAVAALHRLGIIHRDIKPDNIILTDDGGLRLVDLGVARLPRRSEEHTSELQSLMRISYAVFCLKKKK